MVVVVRVTGLPEMGSVVVVVSLETSGLPPTWDEKLAVTALRPGAVVVRPASEPAGS